jgi:hypothetical protein
MPTVPQLIVALMLHARFALGFLASAMASTDNTNEAKRLTHADSIIVV